MRAHDHAKSLPNFREMRDLPEPRRDEILAALAEADFNEIPGRFYHLMRAFAVEFYFSHPEAFAGYPLEPAPQPMGYPPPWI